MAEGMHNGNLAAAWILEPNVAARCQSDAIATI
jgi:hypothetical protein